jgi:ABC-2 type transport system permease protein
MGIGTEPITAATLGLALLALGFGTVALAAGALTGRRGLVLGTTAALAVGAYLTYTVGGQVKGMDGLRKLSPFFYYLGGDPLRTGLDLGDLAVLATIPLALLAVGVWSLNRRDIAV